MSINVCLWSSLVMMVVLTNDGHFMDGHFTLLIIYIKICFHYCKRVFFFFFFILRLFIKSFKKFRDKKNNFLKFKNNINSILAPPKKCNYSFLQHARFFYFLVKTSVTFGYVGRFRFLIWIVWDVKFETHTNGLSVDHFHRSLCFFLNSKIMQWAYE